MTKTTSSPSQETILDTWFVALLCFVSLLSFCSLALLAVGAFTPRNVGMAAGGIFIATLLKVGGPSLCGRLRWQEWLVLAIAVIGVALRSNPSAFLYGGQDPGVYASMAGHFARTGTMVVHDQLLPELEDSPEIRSYYLHSSILRLRQAGDDGRWMGNMLPGVYLHNFEKNEWVFQFYALHPSWLAIGQWLFGVEGQGWMLVLFSGLSIIIGYLITRRITGNHVPGICVALLLATNPAHSYMATFPVSETVAGFFFLSTLYLLLHGHFALFLLPLTALFLTRITGFITAPLLLIALAWMVGKRRDARAIWAGVGVICAYTVSFYWGLWLSPNYSIDIYRGKLGFSPATLSKAWTLFFAIAVMWGLAGYVVVRRSLRVRPLVKWIMKHRRWISAFIVSAILVAALSRGYLLAFTDHYNTHRWFAKRWGVAGHGMGSVGHLSLYTLGLMLSPLGLVVFLCGLYKMVTLACRRAELAPLACLTAGFSGVLLVVQLITPYLYYYGRYLVSELVPLAIICSMVFLELLRQRLPKIRPFVLPAYVAVVMALLFPALAARLSITEAQEFSRAVECIDQITPGRSVVFIDKHDLAFGSYPLATPLKIAFGKRTFSIRYGDFASNPEKLRSLLEYFRGKGFDVYVISSLDIWENGLGLQRLVRLPLTMETIGARRQLPRSRARRTHPMRVYSSRGIEKLPPLCEQLVGARS